MRLNTSRHGGSVERGQALPLGALLLAVGTGVLLLLLGLGGTAGDRARAQAVADAVVLGAAGSDAEAEKIATENGAEIVSFVHTNNFSTATVRFGSAQATARAEHMPSTWTGLHPLTIAALRRAENRLNERIPIVSGLRTRAEQQVLWNNRHLNPYPVAAPGTSRHELGLAVDVPLSYAESLAAIQRETGLCQVLPASDPIHFEPCQMTPTP